MVAVRKIIAAVAISLGTLGLISTAGAAAGIKVCTDANYMGTCETMAADVPDLAKVKGPCSGGWNDCISSMDLAEGMSVKVCTEADYKGTCAVLKDDVKDLSKEKGPCKGGGWDDCISSFDIQ